MEFWNQRTFCLITGASRGIGKAIAVEFGKKAGGGSVFLLVARSAKALEETKAEILLTASDIKVVTAALDLGNTGAKDYLHMINSSFITSGTSVEEFEHMILVHNAGSLGNISLRAIEMDNMAELREYYDLNLLSPIILTSQFFKVFNNPAKQRSIIQISSLAGVQPLKSFSSYSTGKAARDMLMKIIAAEDPSISTLNYAPGPVDTDMLTAAAKSSDADVAREFRNTKINGTALTPIQTVTKLVGILEGKKYTKGEHVDYYDIED